MQEMMPASGYHVSVLGSHSTFDEHPGAIPKAWFDREGAGTCSEGLGGTAQAAIGPFPMMTKLTLARKNMEFPSHNEYCPRDNLQDTILFHLQSNCQLCIMLTLDYKSSSKSHTLAVS
jgi:hypothetical protein